MTIAAVIPVYNGERYIREAVESALRQTRPADELIVVDDGSTDRTPEILRAYADRVDIVRTPNRGLAEARNEGFRRAKSEHVAFLDADDRWRPEKIAVFAKKAEACPKAGLFFSDAACFSDDRGPRRITRCPALSGAFFDRMMEVNWIVSSAVMVRRDLWEKVGPLRSDFLHPAGVVDWEFFLRAVRRASALHIPRVLTEYRQHAASAMHTSLENLRNDSLKVVGSHAADIPPALRRDAEASMHFQSAVRFLAGFNGPAARRDLRRAMGSPRYLLKSLGYWVCSWGGAGLLKPMIDARLALMRLRLETTSREEPADVPDRLYPPPARP